MKRFAVVLGMLLTLPAFAEVAPVYLDDGLEYSDDEYFDDVEDMVQEEAQEETSVKVPNTPVAKPMGGRSSSSRVTASRSIPAATQTTTGRRDTSAAAGRVVAARTTTNSAARGATARTATASRTATAAGAATRSAVAGRPSVTSTRARAGVSATRTGVSTRSGASNGALTSRAATITGSGPVLYNANGSSARVSVGGRNFRSAAIRSGSVSAALDSATVVDNSADMDELAELTDYCKAQYANCMDNYCNVLDDNQGRCSCSSNLKNYAKAEETLKQVTADLQDVATKISYIGLSANEVSTLFSQTVGELEMQSKTDNSQLKANLDKIQSMIIDVQSGNAKSSSSTGMSFDLSGLLDFNIDSTGFDITALLGGGSSNTSSINNQRGEKLYKTATARCKANVLNSCTAQGVDAAIVTNSYDLEIDKQCIAYERSLNDSNEQMAATVRNAKSVLQKARLLVSQQKNEYDMRGCVTELDNCMQDDFVCGTDYEKCLDPTGRYIVNGEIVIGSQPGRAIDNSNTFGATSALHGTVAAPNSSVFDVALYRAWDYGEGKNAWALPYYQGQGTTTGQYGDLAGYIEATVTASPVTTSSENISEFLQNKIGYNKDGVNYGMCMAVLNKCQNYTYTGTGSNIKYVPNNDVIKQYLARVLVQIKSKQDEILNDYAASCITDVNSCLSQNNYPVDVATPIGNTQANIAINACRSNIITCMSVNGYSIANPTPSRLANWVCGIQGGTNCNDGFTDEEYSSGSDDPNIVTVTYNCGSGSGTQVVDRVYVRNYTTLRSGSMCTPQSGYVFDRWTCGGANSSVQIQSNTTCNATYTESATSGTGGGDQTYTVTYSCGTGTGITGTPPASQTYQHGGSFVVAYNRSSGGCSKESADFSGWSNGQTGSSYRLYNAGETVNNLNQDITLTAKYTNNRYAITWYLNGGDESSMASAPTSYAVGSAQTLNVTPTHQHATFAGWCTNVSLQNCSNTVSITASTTGVLHYYAKWTCDTGYVGTDCHVGESTEAQACWGQNKYWCATSDTDGACYSSAQSGKCCMNSATATPTGSCNTYATCMAPSQNNRLCFETGEAVCKPSTTSSGCCYMYGQTRILSDNCPSNVSQLSCTANGGFWDNMCVYSNNGTGGGAIVDFGGVGR